MYVLWGGGENVSLHSSFLWYKTEETRGHELLKLVLSHLMDLTRGFIDVSERGLETFSPHPVSCSILHLKIIWVLML